MKCTKGEIKSKLEVASFLISVLAIILSIMSFTYTIYKDKTDSRELLNVISSQNGQNEIIKYNMAGGSRGQGVVSGITYSVIVSNNSKQRVSIVTYDVQQCVGERRIYYNNMVESVKDGQGQTVLFPISLDAGEAILLKFEVNTLIPSSVNTLVMEKFGTEAEITYEELQRYLGQYSRDIFGNEIEYTEYGDDTFLIKMEECEFPLYGLQLITSKGNVFETYLSRGFID